MESLIFHEKTALLRKVCLYLSSLFRWSIHYFCTFFFIYLMPSFYRLLGMSKWRDFWGLFRIYSKISLWGFGVKLEVEDRSGCFGEKQFIMVSNHRSWLDQVALLYVLKQQPHFFTKESYLDLPILGKGLKNHEAIPVSNQSISKSTKEVVKKYLKDGDSLFIYLEGTRGSGKRLLPFRFGAFKYASNYGLPLLPIYILGSEEILSKKRSLLQINPGIIKIVIGRPQNISKEKFFKEKEEFEKQYKKEYYSLYEKFFSSKKYDGNFRNC